MCTGTGRGSKRSPGGSVKPVVADLHQYDEVEEQDPDQEPHQSEKSDSDPHQSEKSDPDLHQSEKRDPDPHQSGEDPQHCKKYRLVIFPTFLA